MDLTLDQIEEYLEIIATGSKIVDVTDRAFLLKQPRLATRMVARRIYSKELEVAIKEGLLTNEQMRKLITERKIITDEERAKLKDIESKLEGQRILLGKTTRVRANQERIEKIIHNLENERLTIIYKERSKYAMTAESKAEESKMMYLCWSCTHGLDNQDKLHWETYNDYLKEPDFDFRQRITIEYMRFYSGIPTAIVRSVARSNLWRIKYISSVKTVDFVFGVPTAEYSNDMLNLMYWSHYYQNIYDMMPEDQPPDDIIDDDEALDAFMKDYHDEKSREMAARKSKKGYKGKLSAFDTEEVLVTRSNELYEDIEFDTPREANAIKERTSIQKKTRRV